MLAIFNGYETGPERVGLRQPTSFVVGQWWPEFRRRFPRYGVNRAGFEATELLWQQTDTALQASCLFLGGWGGSDAPKEFFGQALKQAWPLAILGH